MYFKSMLILGMLYAPLFFAQSQAALINNLYNQAEAYSSEGEYEQAIFVYNKIIDLDSSDVAAFWGRAISYGELKQYRPAVADIRQVTIQRPNFPDGFIVLGWYLILQGEFLAAREPTEKALAMNSGSMPPTVNLGHIYLLTGDETSARRYYQQTLSLLNSEAEFLSGPIKDFEIFIENGWLVEQCRENSSWMQEMFNLHYREAYHTLNSLEQQIDELRTVEKYVEAVPLTEERLKILTELRPPGHSDITLTTNELGELYREQGQFAKAESLYKQSYQLKEQARGADHPSLLNETLKLALLYKDWGRYKEAEKLLKRTLQIMEQYFGPQNILLAGNLGQLAEVYNIQGRHNEAEPLYQRALSIYQQIPDLQQENIATTMDNLAGTYERQGRYAEAEELMDRALEILENVLGPQHPDIAFNLSNMAYFYNTRGRYTEAEELLNRAIKITEEAKGPDHLSLAATLGNLATTYIYQGRYKETEVVLKRVLNIREKFQGEQHPDVALTLNNLAKLYEDMGRYEKVEALYKRALDISKATFGEQHSHYVTSLANLASHYSTQGGYPEAEALYLQALKIREETLDPQHPDIAVSAHNLGHFYYTLGRYAEVEPLLRRALTIIEADSGPEHPRIATILNSLAGLYEEQGFYAESEKLYLRGLVIAKRLGPEHPDLLMIMSNLGRLYAIQGRYPESEQFYREALHNREKTLGSQHPSVSLSLNNLGILYSMQGRYAEAEGNYRRALKINEQALGEEHKSVAVSLNNLAEVFHQQRRYKEALEYNERALTIKEKSLGLDHPSLATSLNNLAGLYVKLKQPQNAESYYKRSLRIQERSLGEQHPDVSRGFANLASLYRDQGRYEEAEPLFQRALKNLELVFGEDHPDIADCLNNLGGLYYNQGQYQKAAPLILRANDNLLRQISTFFPALSEKERGLFFQKLNISFEIFNSFVFQAAKNNLQMSDYAFNNQLAIKALLLNSSAKVKQQILSSNNQELKSLYQDWLNQREFLAKMYTLSKAEIEQRRISRDSLETVVNDLEKELSSRSETFARARDNALSNWQEVQSKLNPGEAAIEIIRFRWFDKSWTDSVYYAALIVTLETSDQPEMIVLSNGNNLEGKHQEDYQRCRKIKSGKAYRQYWQPIREKLPGVKKVYLSPDGVYNTINLNILYNNESKQYLMDEIDIHLVTNTKDILQFGKKEITGSTAKLFGRPAYNLDSTQYQKAVAGLMRSGSAEALSDQESSERLRAEFSDLAGTEKEVKDIHRLLNEQGWESTPYLGKTALEEAVKSTDNPRVLHIATHGFFIASEDEDFRQNQRTITPISFGEAQMTQPATLNPMLRSGLILAGAESYLKAEYKPDTDDGILTAYEAANLNLNSTELVVLSACETGLGEVRNGEGVYGLQRAFKVAGAKTILMSLWKVDDAATQELMSVFYEKWLKYGNKRRAFRQAQQQLREKYEKPEFWGAFVMVGE